VAALLAYVNKSPACINIVWPSSPQAYGIYTFIELLCIDGKIKPPLTIQREREKNESSELIIGYNNCLDFHNKLSHTKTRRCTPAHVHHERVFSKLKRKVFSLFPKYFFGFGRAIT